MDGTLIEACASLTSLRAKDRGDDGGDQGGGRNSQVDFHGEKHTNATHESKTDTDAMRARNGNGKEAKLSHAGHVLTNDGHGLTLVCAPLTRPLTVVAWDRVVGELPPSDSTKRAGRYGKVLNRGFP